MIIAMDTATPQLRNSAPCLAGMVEDEDEIQGSCDLLVLEAVSRSSLERMWGSKNLALVMTVTVCS